MKRKREIEPERNSVGGTFRCASCDRDFASERAMQTHVAKHITCSHEGCSFSAVPKIVREHYRVKHTNEAPKLPKSLRELVPRKYLHAHRQKVDPESCTWIEARRSNYPTDAKIAEKQRKGQETLDNENNGNDDDDDDDKKGGATSETDRSAAVNYYDHAHSNNLPRVVLPGRCASANDVKRAGTSQTSTVDCFFGDSVEGRELQVQRDRDMARLINRRSVFSCGGSTTSSDGLLRKLIRRHGL